MKIFVMDSDSRAAMLFQALLHTDTVIGVDQSCFSNILIENHRRPGSAALELIDQVVQSEADVVLLNKDVIAHFRKHHDELIQMDFLLSKLKEACPEIAIVGISNVIQPYLRNCWGDRLRLFSFVDETVDRTTVTAEQEMKRLDQMAEDLRTVIASAQRGGEMFMRKGVIARNKIEFKRQRSERGQQRMSEQVRLPVPGVFNGRRFPHVAFS